MKLEDWHPSVVGYVPEWFSPYQYDATKQWGVDRWRLALTDRVHFYTIVLAAEHGVELNEPDMLMMTYGVSKCEDVIRMFFDDTESINDQRLSPVSALHYYSLSVSPVRSLSVESAYDVSNVIKEKSPSRWMNHEATPKRSDKAEWCQQRVRDILSAYAQHKYGPLATRYDDIAAAGFARRHLEVDIATTDKALVEAFKQWLRKERELTGIDQPYLRGKDPSKRSERTARLIGKQQLSKWARWRILGYWDLNLWLEIKKKEKPTPDQWLKILFPDEATHPAPRFDELKAEAEWLLSEKALSQISAAAALGLEQ